MSNGVKHHAAASRFINHLHCAGLSRVQEVAGSTRAVADDLAEVEASPLCRNCHHVSTCGDTAAIAAKNVLRSWHVWNRRIRLVGFTSPAQRAQV